MCLVKKISLFWILLDDQENHLTYVIDSPGSTMRRPVEVDNKRPWSEDEVERLRRFGTVDEQRWVRQYELNLQGYFRCRTP